MATLGPFTHILVPAGKATKLYFAEDTTPYFETADFARPDIGATSGATVLRDGVLVELAENEPDWSEPIGGGCPRLLMRPQAENLKTFPEDIDDANAGWSGVNATINAQTITAPDGTTNASEIIPTASSAAHRVDGVDNSVLVGTEYTLSYYVKDNGQRYAGIIAVFRNSGAFVDSTNIVFDLNDGTIVLNDVGNVTGLVASLESDTIQGFQRIKVSFTTAISGVTTMLAGIQMADAAGNLTFTGDGTSGIYAWGYQYVVGGDTGYVSGGGASTITRSANSFEFTDLVTKGAIGAGGIFSFILKTIWQDTGADVDILKFQTAASADQITLRAKTGGNLILAYEDGGLTELGTGLAVDTLAKLGFSYDGSNLIFSVNGSTSGTATVTLGTITKVVCPAANRYFEIASDVYAGLSPIALNAADLNTETTA